MGVLLVAIPLVFQAVMLAVLFRMERGAGEAAGWALHSKETLDEARRIQTIVASAHGALRGAVIVRDPSFEMDDRIQLHQVPALIRSLKERATDPAKQAALEPLPQAVDEYVAWFRSMEAAVAAGQWPEVVTAFQTGTGRRLVENVERALGQFTAEAMRLDAERVEAAERSRRRQHQALVAAAALMVVVAIGVIWVFATGLSARLGAVTRNAHRLATGQPLEPQLAGTDDVSELDAVLHDTGARLAEAAEAERRQARELERRRDELEQANRDLLFNTQENEMFVYSVSHDLRSPLVNLQGFTQELAHASADLRRELATVDLPAAKRQLVERLLGEDMPESIRFIQSAVMRLSGIVDALLRLSRAGRVEYRLQPTDLTPIVERVVDSLHASLETRAAEVRVHALPAVLGDPAALEQVFANVIGNAVGYLDPARPGRIEVGADDGAQGGEVVTIFVRDNGLGVPAQSMSKLFVAFERLHGDAAPGEGIGLALVKRIVDRHGGRIWIDSTEGEGTTVFIALPAAAAADAPDSTPEAEAEEGDEARRH